MQLACAKLLDLRLVHNMTIGFCLLICEHAPYDEMIQNERNSRIDFDFILMCRHIK